MKNNYLRGVGFCLVATIIWGTQFPVMTGALARVDPFTFTALRYTIASSALLIVLLLREGKGGLRLNGESFLLLWFFGSAGFAGFGFLVFWGQQMAGKTGALTASIMMATVPMLGLLFNWVVRKSRPHALTFYFILLSLFGVVLVITKGDFQRLFHSPQYYTADLLIFAGALCWVTYTMGASFYPQWSPLKYTAMTGLLSLTSIFFVDGVLLSSHIITLPTGAMIFSVMPHLLYTGLISSFLGVLSWNIGNRIITPVNGILFTDIVPITTFIVSAMEGIVPTHYQILGATVTASALVANNVYQRYCLVQLFKNNYKSIS